MQTPQRFQWTASTSQASADVPVNRILAILPPADRNDQPGPDGIRHALVNRVRAEIAAGVYDTEEKWLAAEDRLIRSVSR